MTQSPWFDAFFDPAGMLLLVASVVAGLLAAWWLFPAGLLLWLFLFVRILRDPSLRLNQSIQSRKDLTPRFLTPFTRIQKIQVSIFNSISSAPPRNRRVVQPLQGLINQLIGQAYNLCLRMSPLENFRLVSPAETSIKSDLDKLTAQIASAADPATKKEYEESAGSMQTRLEKYREVCTQLDRFDAQLSSLENDLQVVQTEIISLFSLEPKEAAKQMTPIADRLRQEAEQFKTFH